jgi:RNA-directed DNA polymerase
MPNDLYKASSIGLPQKPSYLLTAWHTLKRKTPKKLQIRTHGIDGQTIADFAMDYFGFLERISKEMRSPGGYRFSPLRPILIKRANKKYRLVCIPTVRDRIVQKAVQEVLQKSNHWKYCKFNGINHGFVRRKSVRSAIASAVDLRKTNQYVYKTDISSFFDNIDRDRLNDAIKAKIPNKSLHTTLFNIVLCDIVCAESSNRHYLQKAEIHPSRGVRQGMPLSPLFANLYLCDFDTAIKLKNLKCVRYADDLIFFAKAKQECNDIHEFCKLQLATLGLQIPEPNDRSQKTQIVDPATSVEFLGINIAKSSTATYVAKIPDDQRSRIRDSILQFADIDYLTRNQISIKNFAQKLVSTISGYEAAYIECADINDFSNRLDQWANKAINKLMGKQLGINYDNLSSKQKQFLTINLR